MVYRIWIWLGYEANDWQVQSISVSILFYTTSVLEINFWVWSSAGSLGLHLLAQGPEEMCLLENQNPSKTSEKMGYFDRVTISLHIL